MHKDDILRFWFEEHGPEDWFAKSDAFDEEIRKTFLPTYESIVRGETTSWRDTARGRLAEIIALDQFGRNMFRGTPEAFAQDELALSLAKEAVAAGALAELTPQEATFLLMPYMHGESPETHVEAARLFTELGNPDALRYELQHKDIVDRFGRYPHRNAILGRASTEEETEFLKTHPGF